MRPFVALLLWLTMERFPSCSVSTRIVTEPSGAAPSATYVPERRSITSSPSARASIARGTTGFQRLATVPRRGRVTEPLIR